MEGRRGRQGTPRETSRHQGGSDLKYALWREGERAQVVGRSNNPSVRRNHFTFFSFFNLPVQQEDNKKDKAKLSGRGTVQSYEGSALLATHLGPPPPVLLLLLRAPSPRGPAASSVALCLDLSVRW